MINSRFNRSIAKRVRDKGLAEITFILHGHTGRQHRRVDDYPLSDCRMVMKQEPIGARTLHQCSKGEIVVTTMKLSS